ncbi:MAG TPA: NAD(P)-dependent oxidoreductase [Thermoanaerobaculia bacterium]|nr:NAD(P)-dependent oxidoreductase [Thermoanaerobaculia bacterium]
MKKAVLIAADVDRSFLERIERDSRFLVRYQPMREEVELVREVSQCEVLVTRHFNKITARVIEAAQRLEVIAQGTSGIDNIDERAAAGRGIPVLNVPGQNANAVAELIIGLMITLTRTVPSYNRTVRAGVWERGDCATRRELRSHRLGIIGLGRVGSRVAALARAFGVSSVAYDPYLTSQQFLDRGATRVETLEALVTESEILTVHVPLTDETRSMLTAPILDRLPRGAIFLNASRGEVVSHSALFERLRSGALGGLALDVYDPEPPESIEWPDDERLIATPHIAGCTREAKESIGNALYEKLCMHYGVDPIA